MSNKIDMLHGPLGRKILLFALPLAASSVLQQLFNAVDVAVVGHFASSEALAAVGSNSPVINLLINIFVGISMGANVVIANHIGQNNEAGVRRAVATSALVAVLSGLGLMVLGMFAARPILELMGTPANVIDLATLYLRIYFCGMPFIMVFNFGSSILRSVGDTKRPLYCLIASGILNAVLNIVLVVGFGMSVDGVAIATVVANILNAVLVVRMLLRETGALKLEPRRMKIYSSEFWKMVKIGVPIGVQGMVFSLSNVVIQSTVNGFGSAAMGGSAASLTYEQLCYFVMASFCGAAVTFVGQNFGAGQKERCKRVFRLCMIMAVISTFVCNAVITIFDEFFVGLFSADPDVYAYATQRIHLVVITQAIACSYEVGGSTLRGMGHSATPAIMTIFGTCLLRLAWVFFVFPLVPTYQGLMTVYPVSWAVTGLLVLTALWRVSRRELA